MTARQVRSLVFVLAMITLGLVLTATAEAQEATYGPGAPVLHSGWVLQYHRVYQGSSWHWTLALGWHTHDHYVYVPHWVLRETIYPPAPYQPIVTHYSR